MVNIKNITHLLHFSNFHQVPKIAQNYPSQYLSEEEEKILQKLNSLQFPHPGLADFFDFLLRL